MLRLFRLAPLVLVAPLLVGLPACQGEVGTPATVRGSGGSGSAGASSGGGNSGAGGHDPVSISPLLPARIRRLTNAEYENSAHALVGNTAPAAAGFAPDTRQGGYTVNDAQRVDSVLIKQLSAAATTLAAQVRTELDSMAPCADPINAGEACAKSFIQTFATKAYRRPIGTDEAQKLLDLYHVAADGATYADGIELIATGVLQSAAFLYLTETGNLATGSQISLTPYETASAISYLITAGPPDKDLLSAAASGQLATPDQRSAAFTRLVSNAVASGSQARIVRVIEEWLGTDRLADTAKDTTAYKDFAARKPAMLNETPAFVQHLIDNKSGTVGELLGANWTATQDQGLIALYAGTPSSVAGEVTLPVRRGILNQGAFLSVYAHASETGPVLRGVAIERRVACMPLASPSVLNITVPPLAVDPTKTTRQRLTQHVTDPVCAACHTAIDSFGFSFELYDGMGAPRTAVNGVPQDNGQNVDSHTTVAVNKDFDGDYADSNALATALSTSASVRECFARNVFRASAGRSDADVQASENAFIDYWHTAAAPTGAATQSASAAAGSILETVRAFITSPNFTLRRAQ